MTSHPHRDLVLINAAGFLRSLGVGLMGVVLGIYLFRVGLSSFTIGLVIAAGLTQNMLDLDAPDHTRLRGLVQKAFMPRLIENMRERIQALSNELLDAAQTRGRMDLVHDYALPIPTTIISENRPLAFGYGVHYCLGAPLARLEGQIAISTLFRRIPDLRFATPLKRLRWRPGLVLRGLESLPVAFSKRAQPGG